MQTRSTVLLRSENDRISSTKMKTSIAVSAGGVIHDDQGRVVLTSRRSFQGELYWGLPKGIVEEGESREEAALREAAEETGFEVEIEAGLPSIDYWFVAPGRGGPPQRIHKFVHYFLMRITGGDPSQHDLETEEVALLEPSETIARVSFDSERSIIDQAARLIRK